MLYNILYLKEILKKTQFNYYHPLTNVLRLVPRRNYMDYSIATPSMCHPKDLLSDSTFLGISMCTPYKFTTFG